MSKDKTKQTLLKGHCLIEPLALKYFVNYFFSRIHFQDNNVDLM